MTVGKSTMGEYAGRGLLATEDIPKAKGTQLVQIQLRTATSFSRVFSHDHDIMYMSFIIGRKKIKRMILP